MGAISSFRFFWNGHGVVHSGFSFIFIQFIRILAWINYIITNLSRNALNIQMCRQTNNNHFGWIVNDNFFYFWCYATALNSTVPHSYWNSSTIFTKLCTCYLNEFFCTVSFRFFPFLWFFFLSLSLVSSNSRKTSYILFIALHPSFRWV